MTKSKTRSKARKTGSKTRKTGGSRARKTGSRARKTGGQWWKAWLNGNNPVVNPNNNNNNNNNNDNNDNNNKYYSDEDDNVYKDTSGWPDSESQDLFKVKGDYIMKNRNITGWQNTGEKVNRNHSQNDDGEWINNITGDNIGTSEGTWRGKDGRWYQPINGGWTTKFD